MMNLAVVFDDASRARAFLSFKNGRIEIESVPGFDVADIQDFLGGLDARDPEMRQDKDGIFWREAVPKGDERYFMAVIAAMKDQGFAPYLIEEYQKSVLLSLNTKKFDAVRAQALGDILTLSEAEVGDFMRGLQA